LVLCSRPPGVMPAERDYILLPSRSQVREWTFDLGRTIQSIRLQRSRCPVLLPHNFPLPSNFFMRYVPKVANSRHDVLSPLFGLKSPSIFFTRRTSDPYSLVRNSFEPLPLTPACVLEKITFNGLYGGVEMLYSLPGSFFIPLFPGEISPFSCLH